MELELPDLSSDGIIQSYETSLRLQIQSNRQQQALHVPSHSFKKTPQVGKNPAIKSGHPFELEDLPLPPPLAPLVVDDPTLYIYVKRYGSDDLLKLKAIDALMHVTGTSFLHLGIKRLKHELKVRELKLSTGLYGDGRLKELSSRLERAVISERNRKLRREGRDKLSSLRRDLKLVGAHVAKISDRLFDAALIRSDFEHMITLIRRGAASPNFESNDGFTALIRAAFCSDAEATTKLLDSNNIDPNYENIVGENALIWSACQNGGANVMMEMVGVSTSVKPPQSRSQTPMISNDDDDGDDIFRIPNGEENLTESSANGATSAFASAASSSSTAVMLSVPETKEAKVTLHPGRSYADVDWETQLGVTALAAAAECGHMDNVIALVELNANINHKTQRRGLTALMVATRHNREAIAFYLLDHGAIVNLKDRGGRDAKEWARLCGHHKLANKLEAQAWRWKRAEVRANAGKRLWRSLKIKSKALKMEAGWSIHIDPGSQCEFFVNKSTGASQWEMPPSVLAQRRSKWSSKFDRITGMTYYYNENGETTFEMPQILNKHWRSKTRPRSELNLLLSNMALKDIHGKDIPIKTVENVEEIDNSLLENLIQRSKRKGIVSIPHVGESIDGYKGIRRILSVTSFLKNDAMAVTKVEWDARVGGVRGRSSALYRSQQATSEYWVEFTRGVLGFTLRAPYSKDPGTAPRGVFVSRVVRRSQVGEAGRVKIGHWVQHINKEYVRDMDSATVARMLDRVERPFRIQFKIPMVVCDYCASTSPHTVCVTCDAILCMSCIVASKHSILHPNHRCKTILQIGKDMTLIPQEKTPSKKKKKQKKSVNGWSGGGVGEGEGEEEEEEVIEYQPKVSYAHLKTLRHSLNLVVSAKDSIERVLGPAHDEWRLSGGERYMSLEDREKIAAEKRRQKRSQMMIYATPPEHNYAMWASGMQKHAEARRAIQQAIDAQEKRLAGDPPIVAPLAASFGIAASVEANAGDRQGAIKWYVMYLVDHFLRGCFFL